MTDIIFVLEIIDILDYKIKYTLILYLAHQTKLLIMHATHIQEQENTWFIYFLGQCYLLWVALIQHSDNWTSKGIIWEYN